MGHKARNRKKYQQRIKTSIHSISTGEGSSGHHSSSFSHGAASGAGAYNSLLDPSLQPKVVMQSLPGPANAPPNMIRPLFPIRPQDRRPIMGIVGPNVGGMDVYGAGPPAGYITGLSPHEYLPPIHDPTEFPSLAGLSAVLNEAAMVVNQFQSETSPFEMISEEFPALPGASASTSTATRNESMPKGVPVFSQSLNSLEQKKTNLPEKTKSNPGIITTLDGRVTNIPSSMINDQFGMIGLLSRFRVAETNPELVTLALGTDLTELGLNLNATESLYPSFGGPWAEGPLLAEDLECPVPQEYEISEQLRRSPDFARGSVREILAPVKLPRYDDDLLFYLFYNFFGDILQMLAASELYNRNWRYHKEERIWINRIPGMQVIEKTPTYERGTYFFFNPISWTRIAKELYIEYDKLEDRPVDPQALHSSLAKKF